MQKIAIVTGGTKGIGRALVTKFLDNDYQVITCARDTSSLLGFGDELICTQADLSTKSGQMQFVEFINDSVSHVDVLVNNAGVYLPGKVYEEEDGVLETMVNTNLFSSYHVTRGVIKGMVMRRSGHIFNICSTASIMPYVNGGSYCISKYAMYGMTKVLREEMKEFGVKVTAVLPGATLTSSFDGTDLPEERFMKASDVAEVVFTSSMLSANACIEEIVLRPQLGDL